MADFPFLDLKRVYAAHKDAYESAALKCLEGGWYVLGEEVKKFETSFASHHQAAGAAGAGSGSETTGGEEGDGCGSRTGDVEEEEEDASPEEEGAAKPSPKGGIDIELHRGLSSVVMSRIFALLARLSCSSASRKI